eukprot:4244900-Pyramimonas_sp.AAC.1
MSRNFMSRCDSDLCHLAQTAALGAPTSTRITPAASSLVPRTLSRQRTRATARRTRSAAEGEDVSTRAQTFQ